MKKTIAILLCGLMILALCACNTAQTVDNPEPTQTSENEQTENTNNASEELKEEDDNYMSEESEKADGEFETIGDVIGRDTAYSFSNLTENHYVYVFEYDGVPTRVIADVTPEQYKKINEIDFYDPDKDAKTLELISDLKIARIDDLSTTRLTDEECENVMGKTGQEMLDDGFIITGYSAYDDYVEVFMSKDVHEYSCGFDGLEVDLENGFNQESILELKCNSISYMGVIWDSVDIDRASEKLAAELASAVVTEKEESEDEDGSEEKTVGELPPLGLTP
jgi:uncharacterized FlaG/YvyC family protein